MDCKDSITAKIEGSTTDLAKSAMIKVATVLRLAT